MKDIIDKHKNKKDIENIINEVIDEVSAETIVNPDLEEAFVGVVMRMGQPDIMCYNYDKVIDIYIEGGMTREEAIDYFYFNTIGAWCGETTPCFIRV